MNDIAQHKTETKEFRQQWIEFIYNLQDKICKALEDVDGNAKFNEDEWRRAEGKGGGPSWTPRRRPVEARPASTCPISALRPPARNRAGHLGTR